MKTRISLVFSALLAATSASAEWILWTNAGNGSWNTVADWSPNQVPSTNDIAVITNAGTYTVTLNVSPSIAGLLLGGSSGTQTLATTGRILTVNGDATVGTNGVILLSGGTLSGDNQVNLQGTITWNSGVLNTNAIINVAHSGRITMATSSTKLWYGSVTNAGIVEWLPNGGISMSGPLYNLAGGLFDALVDGASILAAGNNAVIVNDGLVRRTNGTGTITCYVPLINNGLVDVQTGTLSLRGNPVFNSGCEFTGAGIVRLPDGTNTFNGNIYSENLVLNGTLTGSSQVSGSMTWESGAVDATATLTVATNSQLLIGSTFQHAKTLNGSLTNAGTIIWTPNGSLVLGQTLHNLTNAVFNIQTANSILATGPNSTLINDGVLRRSGDGGGTLCYVRVINNGTVDVQSGTLDLRGGGVLNDGSAFTGAGLTRMSTGTNTLNGTVYSENLELSGTTLVSSGLLTGALFWTAGTIEAVLPFNIPSNSILTIGDGFNNTKFFHGDLTNDGTIVWLPTGSLQLGGHFHNLTGGLFDIHGDILLGSNAPTALFINDGIVRKSAGNNTAGWYPRLINDGIMEISSGRLSCAGGFSNPTGTIVLAGGIFQNNRPIDLSGGLLSGWGSMNASLTNSGTVRPSPTSGVLTINGNYVQTLAGIAAFDLGGNLAGSNQSRLNITGSAGLGGCINVGLSPGYVPGPGTNFTVMTFASHDGEFDCGNGFFLLGQGRRLMPVYAPTSLTLSTFAAPEPIEVPLSVTVENGSALIAWPFEFAGYELYWSTNLSQTNWTIVPDITNRFLESPPLAHEKFFRLITP